MCKTILVVYKRILIPTNGTLHALAAGKFAARIAETHNSDLRLYIVDNRKGPMGKRPNLAIASAMCSDANIENLEMVSAVFQTHGHLRLNVGELICQHALEWAADIIVMGAYGPDDRQGSGIGSVSKHVIQNASCPVLIVRETSNLKSNTMFENPLIGVDFSDYSTAAAQLCGDLFSESTGTLLHISNSNDQGRVSNLLIKLRAFAIKNGLQMECELGKGDPSEELIKHAINGKHDIIVVGSHERAKLEELIMGTVADRLLHEASIPMLFIPKVAKNTIIDSAFS